MLRRKILKLVFPAACLACLTLGLAGSGGWIILLGGLLALPAWLAACKWGSGFFPTTALGLSIGLAAAGLLMSASPVWMILAASFAIAGWDIVMFQHQQHEDAPARETDLLEKRHYRNLAMALGFGVTLALAGSMIRIQIPFGWMLLLAAIALLCLEGLGRNLKA
jgi:uncharacterized membrane protein